MCSSDLTSDEVLTLPLAPSQQISAAIRRIKKRYDQALQDPHSFCLSLFLSGMEKDAYSCLTRRGILFSLLGNSRLYFPNQGSTMIKQVSGEISADAVLDARDLSCPMPLLRVKQEIERIKSGQILLVQSTDPGSRNDILDWCARIGHEYLYSDRKSVV